MEYFKKNEPICFIFDNLLQSGAFLKNSDDASVIEATKTDNTDKYASVVSYKDTQVFAYRSADELQELQNNHVMILVLSGLLCSFLEADLPFLPEKKARIAIPYTLEENILEPVDSMHFAWEEDQHSQNQYKVLAISKELFTKIIEKTHELGLQFDIITTDFLALAPVSVVMFADRALVSLENFKGSVYLNLLDNFLQNYTGEALVFKTKEDECLWLAQNLQKEPIINLLQGPFQKETKVKKSRWLKFSLYALFFSILFFVAIYAAELIILNKRIKNIDFNITKTYKTYFIKDEVPYDIRSHLENLLGLGNSKKTFSLWKVLNKFSLGLKNQACKINKFEFQKQLFIVTLSCDNFSSLESIESALKKEGLRVNAKNTASQKDSVLAVLELK